jgi:hypothetical protein
MSSVPFGGYILTWEDKPPRVSALNEETGDLYKIQIAGEELGPFKAPSKVWKAIIAAVQADSDEYRITLQPLNDMEHLNLVVLKGDEMVSFRGNRVSKGDPQAALKLAIEKIKAKIEAFGGGFNTNGFIYGGESSCDDWMEYADGPGMFVDVNYEHLKLESAPHVVTSLHGNSSHWLIPGGSCVYNVSKNGFRVFIQSTDLNSAKEYNWRIQYLLFSKKRPQESLNSPSGKLFSGESSFEDWQPYESNGLMVTLDFSHLKLSNIPKVVTSLHGTSNHWTIQGGSCVYNVSKNGFQVYINTSDLKSAKEYNWRIQYLAYS